jgi:chromosome segregation ATPase
MESYRRGFTHPFRGSNLVLWLGIDHEVMAQEITPNEIREANLNRRLRGYDLQETEQLLAEVAESYEKVLTEREALSEQLQILRHEQTERERAWRLQVEQLKERLSDREGRVSDLEAELARLEEERSKQLEKASRLIAELASAQATKAGQGSELAEHRESVARLETRERALVEQVAMLEAQLEQADETDATPAERRAMADLEERAARTLLRLDRLVERAERETRRDAEIMLRKVRERVDEILRSAETQPQPPADEPVPVASGREDPVTGRSETDGPEEEMGEAAWTSRIRSDRIPERSP